VPETAREDAAGKRRFFRHSTDGADSFRRRQEFLAEQRAARGDAPTSEQPSKELHLGGGMIPLDEGGERRHDAAEQLQLV
jgi:hypothetical protein